MGEHLGDGGLGAIEDTFDIDLVEAVEIALGGGEEGADVGDAGVVDEDVKPGAADADVFEDLFDLGVVADVAGDGAGAAACGDDLICGGLGGLEGEIEHFDMGTASGEEEGDGLANAGACAGDDGGFMGEGEHGESGAGVVGMVYQNTARRGKF